jgi:hypothetical protein
MPTLLPPTFQPWFTDSVALAKDIGGILSALVSVGLLILAAYGLHKWQTELRGHTEHDVARQMIKAILDLRDAIRKTRVAVVFDTEFMDRPIGTSESKDEYDAIRMVSNEQYAYGKRLSGLLSIARQFEAAAIEAEVLWRDKATTVTKHILQAVNEINATYTVYYPEHIKATRNPLTPGLQPQAWRDTQRKILFANTEDEFAEQVAATIAEAVAVFRPFVTFKK